jgi:hypothetical protein
MLKLNKISFILLFALMLHGNAAATECVVAGIDMAAYRVAAVHFFKKNNIQECVNEEGGYLISFSRVNDYVAVKFTALAKQIDPADELERRKVLNEIWKRRSRIYLIDPKNMTIARFYEPR